MTTATMVLPGFEYAKAKVSDFRLTEFQKTNDEGEPVGRKKIGAVEHDQFGRLNPTERFMTSLQARFGFSQSIFGLYSPDEVFKRITEVHGDAELNLCIQKGGEAHTVTGEETGAFDGHLLAVASDKREVLFAQDAYGMLKAYGGERIEYANGILSCSMAPASGEGVIQIGPDGFKNRYQVQVPIDAYGQPSTYLALLRLACTNFSVAFVPAFRGDIAGGGKGKKKKDTDSLAFALERALEQFDNPEGFDALRGRFESAYKTRASVHEANLLYRVLDKVREGEQLLAVDSQGSQYDLAYESYKKLVGLTGDLYSMYGVTDLNAIAEKRQRIMPTNCKVMDLFNFASEMATYRVSDMGKQKFQGFIGSIVATEFDLEAAQSERIEDQFDDFVAGGPMVAGPAPSTN